MARCCGTDSRGALIGQIFCARGDWSFTLNGRLGRKCDRNNSVFRKVDVDVQEDSGHRGQAPLGSTTRVVGQLLHPSSLKNPTPAP